MATYYVRTDGSDSNAGTGSATNQAWQTITKAIGATGIAPGDTLYIAPGVYRGNFTAAFTNPASEGQRITIAGNPTASEFSGVTAGPVVLTNWITNTSPSGMLFSVTKDYITYQDIFFNGYALNSSPAFGAVVTLNGIYTIARRCGFYSISQSGENYSYSFVVPNNQRGPTIDDCVFIGICNVAPSNNSGTAYNSQSIIRNSLFMNSNTGAFTLQCLRIDSVGSNPVFGGVNVTNCRFIGNTGIRPVSTFRVNPSFPVVVQNCIFDTVNGITSNLLGDFVESYNIFNCQVERTNVATGTGSLTRAFVSPDYSLSRVSGWGNLPFWSNHLPSASQNAGINTNSDTADFYGVTWLTPSTPTMGPIEYFNNTFTGVYIPTERNASTITIAPGSTSQSIELYLGATGLTASTAGLSAYYNRTRSADVQINLQARNITQNWTSGGFAEVNPNTMPGVYRLDIPNEALASGADDVTVVVRGASGTNGAVMSIKLSSGGLTTAQTASAVWNALTNDHTTHGTFGWNVLRADQDSKEGLVTLHQSGGVSRVDADVHAVANDTAAATALKGALIHDGTGYVDSDVVRVSTSTAAADELEGALLHNGTDYIDYNLVGGNSTRVFVGRFQMTQTGTTQGDIIEAFTTDTPAFELQLFDGDNNLVPVTGATLGLRILDVASTVVETGTPTIEYGTGGIVRWTAPGTYLSIGCPAGMYRLFVDRTVSGTTTTFGPLQIKVQVQ